MNAGKVHCSADGCHRWTSEATAIKRWGSADVSILCGSHWRRLTKRERAAFARIKRIARRYGWESVGARSDRIWSALVSRAGKRPPVEPTR